MNYYNTIIVGAGIAGLTLADQMQGSLENVVILESGGSAVNSRVGALKKTISEGIEIKEGSRERVLGGSSLTWSGALACMEDSDFTPIEGLHNGWPIEHSEVLSSLIQCASDYGFSGPEDFDTTELRDSVGVAGSPLDLKVVRIQNPPLRYATALLPRLLARELRVFSDSTVSGIEQISSRKKGRASWKVHVKNSRGESSIYQADRVVLAAGAIETVRLLLHSRSQVPALKMLPALGKYFMNHPKGSVGKLIFKGRISDNHPFFAIGDRGLPGIIGLRLNNETLIKNGIGNSYARLVPEYSRLVALLRVALLRVARFLGPFLRPQATGESAERMNSGTPQKTSNAVSLPKPSAAKKKRFSFPVAAAHVAIHADMTPREDNCVYLSDDLDFNGVPFPVVRHGLSKPDKDGVEELLAEIKSFFEKGKLGKFELAEGSVEQYLTQDASHHLGGARMGSSTEDSVVDPNLQVHGAPGLFVLGGAVFPTGGNANPTLYIVALARRLARFLDPFPKAP